MAPKDEEGPFLDPNLTLEMLSAWRSYDKYTSVSSL
jgi:hypothetical protein